MMISIALIGGSPGASPKPKTSTSVPTPPQSRGRSARADAERDEADDDEALEGDQDPVAGAHCVCSALSCWHALVSRPCGRARGRPGRGPRPLVRPPDSARARAACANCSSDSSSESASSSSESSLLEPFRAESAQLDTISAASSPCSVSGMPALSIPSTIVSAACTPRSTPLRRNPVRPCGVSDCGSSPPAVLSARRPDVLDDRLELAAPDGDRAADALRPLAGRNRLAAPVAVADQRGDDDHGDDADGGEEPRDGTAHALLPRGGHLVEEATSSFQKRSTVGMLTRSSGECGNSICGPNESMSRPAPSSRSRPSRGRREPR